MACDVCGEETTKTLELFGQTITVDVACRCRREALEKEKAAEKERECLARKRRLKAQCFCGYDFNSCIFSNDDGKSKTISDALMRYVSKFDEMKKQNIGIILTGPVGSGKTFLAACVANALIDQGTPVVMTNFAYVVNQLQNSFEGRNEYLNFLASVPLLILDDLGIERGTSYMQEQVYTIIDSRYRARKPVIITTNISISEIRNPKEISYERIFDRVLEMCHPIQIDTPSRRKQNVPQKYKQIKEILGV